MYAMDRNGITCSCGEYRMIGITSHGYIEDNNCIQYPLSNVISIEWIVAEEIIYNYKDVKRKIHNTDYLYKIYYNDDELKELKSLKPIE